VSTQGNNPHLATATGKPRARAVGLTFRGTPGAHNAITDVPGVEVGYRTLIEGDKVRTGGPRGFRVTCRMTRRPRSVPHHSFPNHREGATWSPLR
jgi:hypothetical protein